MVIFNGNVCEDDFCPHRKKCANHRTAGDFRSEDGDTPNVRLSEGNIICDRTLRELGHGMVCLKDGKLMIYQGPYEPCYWDYSE